MPADDRAATAAGCRSAGMRQPRSRPLLLDQLGSDGSATSPWFAGTRSGSIRGMWSRLTDPCRRALRLAQERSPGAECANTEDVLVGLLAERDGIAALALTNFGLGSEEAIADARGQPTASEEQAPGTTRFSRPVKMALECALQEAMFLGQHHADTEHLLLGLLRTTRVYPDSAFARVVGRDNQLALRSEIRRLVESRDLRDGA